MRQKIVVLSPHLDDAVISCADHIQHWSQHSEVTIITIFSSFFSTSTPHYSQKLLKRLGFSSTKEYEQQRIKEDKKAMELLGVKWRHLGLVDGGFRSNNTKPLYPSTTSLFSSKVHRHDTHIYLRLKSKIMEVLPQADHLVVPLGIGNHIDHLLIKEAAIHTSDSRQKLWFYSDAPYFLHYSKWLTLWQYAAYFFPRWHTPLFTSSFKHQVLKCYKSQFSLLFGKSKKIYYPEIIFN